MRKQKKWVAVEDYDELVAEVARQESRYELMCEMLHDVIVSGEDMYELAVQGYAGLYPSKQFKNWKKVIEKIK
ncbi:hypothetical protein CCP3SC1AL1_3500003 [Gammaproteobacteria bacterium]